MLNPEQAELGLFGLVQRQLGTSRRFRGIQYQIHPPIQAAALCRVVVANWSGQTVAN